MRIGGGFAAGCQHRADIGIDDSGGEGRLARFHAAEIDAGGDFGQCFARDHHFRFESCGQAGSGLGVAIDGRQHRIPFLVLPHDAGIDHLKILFQKFIHHGGFRSGHIDAEVMITIPGLTDILLIDEKHDTGIAHALNEVLHGIEVFLQIALIDSCQHANLIEVISLFAFAEYGEVAHISAGPGENTVFHDLIVFYARLRVNEGAENALHGLALGIIDSPVACSSGVVVGDGADADRFNLRTGNGQLRADLTGESQHQCYKEKFDLFQGIAP